VAHFLVINDQDPLLHGRRLIYPASEYSSSEPWDFKEVDMALGSTRVLVMLLVAMALGSVATVAVVASVGFEHIRRTEEREIERGVAQLAPAYELKIAEKQEAAMMEGFLLTGDPRMLEAWEQNERYSVQALQALQRLGIDPVTLEEIRRLDALDEEQKDRIVALWRAGLHEAARLSFVREGQPVKQYLAGKFDGLLERQKRELASMHADVLRVERSCTAAILGLALALPPMVLALAILVYRRVVVPLREVEAASRAIAAGRLDIRLAAQGSDELGSVAAAFNTMASTVEATFGELRKQDRFKDEFLAVVSHELRTPLNYIQGFASLLEDGELDAQQRRYVGDIHDASGRMLRMVNDLLDGAAVQAGKLAVQPDEVDYARLVEEVLGQVRPLAERKRLALQADVGELGRVRLDDQRIGQVLTNLLANAIKFTPRGGTIAVEVFRRGDEVVTAVHDNGIGIEAAAMPHLFKRFAQLDMSQTRRAGGTGLGLWISKGIVEAHGGRIEVQSRPRLGSTFTFALPQAG
jgi:signal transduction histidine kinase